MAINDKSRRGFHPAVSILSWLLFALAVELAEPSHLLWFALPATLMLAKSDTLRRFVLLVWKARWLWLALMLLYAWTTPGILVFSSEYSPTKEGLYAGLQRVGRLILLLAVLARLLSEFVPRELAGGIYVLTRPLSKFGLEPRALAVRLALTLEQVEHLPKAGKWLELLTLPIEQTGGHEEIQLFIPSIGYGDILMLIAVIAMLGVVLA